MTRVPYARAPQKLVRRNPPGRFLTKPKPHRFCCTRSFETLLHTGRFTFLPDSIDNLYPKKT